MTTQWIPVGERLPDDDRQVLAVNSVGHMACVTTIYKNTDGLYDGEDATPEETTEPIGDITHWMPLPEPPKSKAACQADMDRQDFNPTQAARMNANRRHDGR